MYMLFVYVLKAHNEKRRIVDPSAANMRELVCEYFILIIDFSAFTDKIISGLHKICFIYLML